MFLTFAVRVEYVKRLLLILSFAWCHLYALSCENDSGKRKSPSRVHVEPGFADVCSSDAELAASLALLSTVLSSKESRSV